MEVEVESENKQENKTQTSSFLIVTNAKEITEQGDGID